MLVLDQVGDERRGKQVVMNVDARAVHCGFIQRFR